ncbi:MAG: BamA/TamA family outer membrane protein [Alphaproteobacteria bacterium]|nr:BamA/TamA family outer membrane protein [Alphaproteobacteria bacterium]MCB9699778.1 BamA/TamA family outer membrane protein [Alphaproteobacteria bacterium]
MRIAAALALTLIGCVPARHKVDGTIVRRIHFEGNGGLLSGQSDYQLRQGLEERASAFGLTTWPLIYTVDPKVFRSDLMVRDAYRLETWYAHHGWFDARFLGWEVRTVRRGHQRRAAIVDLIGTVDPGEPSVLRSMTIEGLGTALKGVGNAVLRNASIREGDSFDLEALQDTRDTLVSKLRDHARPYASVVLEVQAHPEEHAVDVVLRASPGIAGAFGPVTVVGNDAVRDRFVLDAARVETGASYRYDALRQAQRRLFDLGTFSVVTVEPDLSDPSRVEVPVDVRLTEARFRTFRVGVGLDYDSYLLTPRASARFRHVNVFHELLRFDLGVRAGVAVAPAAEAADTLPTWGIELGLRDPVLFSQRFSLEATTEIEQDVYNGLWNYRRPQADLHLVWHYSDAVQLGIGPHAEQYVFLGDFGPREQAAQQRLFGIESEEAFRYELTSLDQFAQWDWRDDPVRTHRGSWYTLFLREAVPLTNAGYGFFKATAEARRYVPVRFSGRSAFPLTVAGRTAAELVVPFAKGGLIPLPERAFLGGPNSLRGFRANQVGPYTTLCTYDPVTTRDGFLGLTGDPVEEQRLTRYHLPDGGTVAGQVGAEARYDWIYGILLSTFVDVGALSSDLGGLGPEDVRFSGGIGARYDTLVGPIRFDLSFRPLYPEDQGPTRFAQCRDPVDEVPRVYDFFGNFGGLEHPPFAMVFYLTFGEAF